MNRMGMLLAAVALLAAGACGGSDAGDKSDGGSDGFTVSGTMTLKQIDLGASPGDSCAGTDGYEDIREGTSVVVRDADGKKVALGELGPGERETLGESDESGWCAFPIEVQGVPGGGSIYSIEVSSRGEIDFEKAEADGLAITLG